MSDPSVRDYIQRLQALTGRLRSRESSSIVANGSYGANCILPLSLSQSHLLADLVTTFVPRSTWWSTLEGSDSWVLCGEVGEASGPRVTAFITATSDKDVFPLA